MGRSKRERGRTRESNRAVLDTSAENTLASCQSGGARLIDFLLLFNQHFPLRSSFPSQCVLIPTLRFLPPLLPSQSPHLFMSGRTAKTRRLYRHNEVRACGEKFQIGVGERETRNISQSHWCQFEINAVMLYCAAKVQHVQCCRKCYRCSLKSFQIHASPENILTRSMKCALQM